MRFIMKEKKMKKNDCNNYDSVLCQNSQCEGCGFKSPKKGYKPIKVSEEEGLGNYMKNGVIAIGIALGAAILYIVSLYYLNN